MTVSILSFDEADARLNGKQTLVALLIKERIDVLNLRKNDQEECR